MKIRITQQCAERVWVGSSLVGLVVSAALLTLSLHDEARRRALGVNGVLEIVTQAAIVLKAQLTVYFALALVTTTVHRRGERIALLIAGNVVLTSAAVYRLRVRRRMAAWTALRNRRSTDPSAVDQEVIE